MQSNKVQSIVSVLRFLFTVVFYVSRIVSFCISKRVPTTLYLRSLYTQISPMSRVHTRHTHKGKTHLTRLSVWSLATGSGPQPPEATCRDLWMEVVLKLVAVALVKVPQPMSMWVGSNHLIWQYLAWIDTVFSRLVKQMASNQNRTVLLLFLDIVYECIWHISYCVDPTPSWVAHDSASAFQRPQVVAAAQVATGSSAHDAEMNWVLWGVNCPEVLVMEIKHQTPPTEIKWFDGVVCCFRELSVPCSSWLWPECWRTTLLIDQFAQEVPSRDMVWKHPNANRTLQMSPSLKQRQEKNDIWWK